MSIRKLPAVNAMKPEALRENDSRLAAHLGAVRAHASRGDHGEEIEVVARELGETKGVVAEMLKAWTAFQKNHNGAAERGQEMSSRMQAVEQLLVKIEQQGGARGPSTPVNLIAQSFIESEGFDAFRKERVQNSGKLYVPSGIRAALVGDGAGGPSSDANSTYPVQTDHLGLVPNILSPLRLLDALPVRPVTTDSVDYIQLMTGDDADYQEGQSTEKKNVDLGGILRKADIATIAAHTTVSKQLLGDAAGLEAEIKRVFNHKVRLKAQRELIEGDGAQFHIEGLLEQSSEATATGSNPADRLGYVISAMEDDGFQPDLIVLGRGDWFGIQVQKDSTGRYIYGPPTAPIPPAIWNTRIVIAPNVPADTALVIDSQTLSVLDREQPSIYMTRDHLDYATRNLVLILAEIRIGLAVYDLGGVRRLALEGSGSSSS